MLHFSQSMNICPNWTLLTTLLVKAHRVSQWNKTISYNCANNLNIYNSCPKCAFSWLIVLAVQLVTLNCWCWLFNRTTQPHSNSQAYVAGQPGSSLPMHVQALCLIMTVVTVAAALHMACIIQQKDARQWFAELAVDLEKVWIYLNFFTHSFKK